MKIKELLNKPETWIQGAFAKDEYGSTICSGNERACHWCLAGALLYCYTNMEEYCIARNKIEQYIGSKYIVEWNDEKERTYEEVKNVCVTLDV